MLVVDSRGEPLSDFPLVVAPSRRQLQGVDRSKCTTARTDRDGHAVFPGLRAFVRGTKVEFFLIHDVCFERQPYLILDQHNLANEVLRSTQPAFGSIEIVALDSRRLPARRVDRAELSPIQPTEEDDPTLVWSRRTFDRSFGEDNRTRFDYVELGRDWSVSAFRIGSKRFRPIVWRFRRRLCRPAVSIF